MQKWTTNFYMIVTYRLCVCICVMELFSPFSINLAMQRMHFGSKTELYLGVRKCAMCDILVPVCARQWFCNFWHRWCCALAIAHLSTMNFTHYIIQWAHILMYRITYDGFTECCSHPKNIWINFKVPSTSVPDVQNDKSRWISFVSFCFFFSSEIFFYSFLRLVVTAVFVMKVFYFNRDIKVVAFLFSS